MINMSNAQRIKQLRKTTANVTTADDADRKLARRALQACRMGVKTGDYVLGNRARVASGGVAELNSGRGQRAQVNVINTGCGAADKSQTTAFDELRVDLAD